MYPPEVPETAFYGGANVPDAGGAGDPLTPPPVGIPSVGPAVSDVASMPSPGLPAGPPDYASLLARLTPQQDNSGKAKFMRAMQLAIPAIVGGIALANKNRGAALEGFASKWNAAEQQNRVNQERDALMKERLATAIKNLQAQDMAQKRIDATAAAQAEARKAAADKARWAEKRQAYDRLANTPGSDNLVTRLNTMIDNGEDPQQYLNSTSIKLGDGTSVPLADVAQFAVMGPDGYYMGGKSKEPKEVIGGSAQDWVERGRRIAIAQNGGKPLTDELQKAVDTTSLNEFKNLGPAGDLTEINLALKRQMETINALRIAQLEANMTPQARAAKRLGTEATRIADLDTGIQEAERLRTLLKVHGLDTSNSPIGPNVANLLAKGGIHPGDIPSDIVQGAAFTKAKLFTALGRGNAGRSMIMYKTLGAHLPDSIQTGQQLATVLDDVIREYQGTRHNDLRAKGVADEEYPFEHTGSNGTQYLGQKFLGPDGKNYIVTGFTSDGKVKARPL